MEKREVKEGGALSERLRSGGQFIAAWFVTATALFCANVDAQLAPAPVAPAKTVEKAPPISAAAAKSGNKSASGSRPWDYCWSLGRKFEYFFKVHNQTRLVVVGDSRGDDGIDPRAFYGEANKVTPLVFNFGEGGIGLDVEEVILNEYVPHTPKLEWVIWQISARIFNKYYQDTGIEKFRASGGYAYDRAHPQETWATASDKPFTLDDVPWGSSLFAGGYTVRDWRGLCETLVTESAKTAPSPYRRVWELLSPDGQKAVQEMSQNTTQPNYRRGNSNQNDPRVAQYRQLTTDVSKAFDSIIKKREFYRPEDFVGVALDDDAHAMLPRLAAFSDADSQRFNRLLLEAVFPGKIQQSHPTWLAYGWHAVPLGGHTDPAQIPELLKAAELAKYELDPDRVARFERVLQEMAKRNVKVLGFTAPMHYGLAKSAAADDDGTGHAAYGALMQTLREMTIKYPNFHFVDIHRGGDNGFKDEEFFNWDHVNDKGAVRLTRMIMDLHKRLDAQPKLDMTPPAILSVTAAGEPTRVVVSLSEPVKPEAAKSPANYAISGGVTVQAAELGEDMRTLTLRTTPLAEGTRYTVTIAKVVDRFDNPLPDAPVAFTFVKALEPKNTTPNGYVWDKLQVGRRLYVDQPTALTQAPPAYIGLDFLRTAEKDKATTADLAISFDVNYPTRIYVAHDEALLFKPAWLGSFTYTWDFLIVGTAKLRLAYKDFPQGKVTLGGNAGEKGMMYVVLAQPLGAVK
jgi:hypothetical protein